MSKRHTGGLGDAPIEAKYHRKMNALAQTLDEWSNADLLFHDAVLHASALAAYAPRFAIHGTRGSYLKNGLDTQEDQLKDGLRPGQPGFGAGNEAGRLHVLRDDGQEADLDVPNAAGNYADLYRALAAAIREGKPFPVSPQDAIDVMTLVELAMQSAKEGRTLAFVRQS